MSTSVRHQISFKSLSDYAFALSRVPPGLHKGQRGRIGVVGGSDEYTGAPYFAGISSELVGSDIVHIFCHPSASIPIKSYSPDLIVHPLFGYETNCFGMEERKVFLEKVKKLDVLVLGPGCGTSSDMLLVMETVIDQTKRDKVPLICDADVFRIPVITFKMLIGHQRCVLTPNLHELSLIENYLSDVVDVPNIEVKREQFITYEIGHCEDVMCLKETELIQRVARIADRMKGPIVFLKGQSDIITDGSVAVVSRINGSIRRCGGQGDVFSGILGAIFGFLTRHSTKPTDQALGDPWMDEVHVETRLIRTNPKPIITQILTIREMFLAAAIASATIRYSAYKTELACKGYMTTSDLIKVIGREFKGLHSTLGNMTWSSLNLPHINTPTSNLC